MTSQWIPGWSDFVDIYSFMYSIAPPNARFVEIGCFFGSSATFMGELIRGGQKAVDFTTVDAFDLGVCEPVIADLVKEECRKSGQPDWLSLVNYFMAQCGVAAMVKVAVSDSVAMSRRFENASLDFVFIDGDHRYAAVSADIEAWRPKVKPGGWIGGHDYDRPDVERAALERFDRFQVLSIPPRSWLVQLPAAKLEAAAVPHPPIVRRRSRPVVRRRRSRSA